MRKLLALLLLAGTAANPAAAQYYGDRPYGDRPPPPPPGYYPPPPPGAYYPPPPRRPFGGRCAVTIEGEYGPREMICPIRDPKPLGEPCGCPAPGYRRGFVGGSTIR